MTTRRESVRLELDDAGFSSAMVKDAALVAALSRELDGLDRRFATSRGQQAFIRDVDRTSVALDRGTKSIDQYSGRLGLIAQGIAVLGPAISPLVAGSVPALTGLTAGLGATAGAIGVTVLAFNGLGDAMKSVNDYQLDPTPEKLAKVRQELEKLGPAGAHFVAFLDEVGPKFGELQRAARDGLFPGIESGIDSIMDRLPQVKAIVTNISTTMGDLAADAGESLAGPKWDNFFTYLDHRAGPILRDFAQAAGNVGEGLANMLVAFDPATAQFSDGLLKMTERFAEWSRGLDENQSFQDFLAYVQEKGPQVVDLLGSLIDALVQIGTAAAPVGDVVLPTLTTLLDILAAIAKSDLGTPIVTALALWSAGSLAMRAFGIEAGVSAGKFVAAEGSKAAAIQRTIAMLREEAAAAAINTVSGVPLRTTFGRGGVAAGIGRGITRGVGYGAGIGLLATGAADNMGVSNTATLGLVGSMIAPGVGTAIGALTGLILDLGDAEQEATRKTQAFARALASPAASIDTLRQGAQQQLDEMERYNKIYDGLHSKNFLGILGTELSHPIDTLKTFADELDGTNDKMKRMQEEAGRTAASINGIADVMYATSSVLAVGSDAMFGDKTTSLFRSKDLSKLRDMTQAEDFAGALDLLGPKVEQIQPALDHLGLTFEDLASAGEGGASAALNMGRRISGAFEYLNSGRAKVDGVNEALAGLGDTTITTAQAAEDLKSALDSLLDPQINLTRAQDQWIASLRHLSDDLDENNKTLKGNSDAAIKNREAIRGRVEQYKDLLVNEANAGATSEELTAKMKRQRQALIDSAESAGLNKDAVKALIAQFKLTPEFIKTIIDAQDKASPKVKQAQRNIDSLHGKSVFVDIITRDRKTAEAHNIPDARPVGADGTTVPKTGLPYADRHPYLLADGEEVISNRYGQADRHRGLLKAINAGRLADGGTAWASSMASLVAWSPAAGVTSIGTAVSAFAVQMTGSTRELKASLRDVNHALKDSQKALDAETEARDKAKAAVEETRGLMAAYQQQVRANFTNDPFAGVGQHAALNLGQTEDGRDWASILPASVLAAHQAAADANAGFGAGSILTSLQTDMANLDAFEALKRKLRRRGLHGQALLEIDTLDEAQAAASFSGADLKRYQRLMDQRARDLKVAGRADANAVYAAKLDRQTAELRAVRAEMRSTKEEIRALMGTQRELEREADKSRQRAAKTTAEGVGREVRAIGSRAKSAAGR